MNKNILLLSAMLLTTSVAVVDVRAANQPPQPTQTVTVNVYADGTVSNTSKNQSTNSISRKLKIAAAVAGLIYIYKNGYLSSLTAHALPLASAITSRLPNVDSMESLRVQASEFASTITSRLPNVDSMESLNLASKAKASELASYLQSSYSMEKIMAQVQPLFSQGKSLVSSFLK